MREHQQPEAVTIVFDGAPRAQARARFARGHAYTPAPTRGFQCDFGWCAKAAMAGRPPFQCAVNVSALFELAIPASWPKRKRADAITGLILPTIKPDLDNFLKAVLDACNRIVFADDAQIIEISARKIYGIGSKTVLTIFPLPDRAHAASARAGFQPGGNQSAKEPENAT